MYAEFALGDIIITSKDKHYKIGITSLVNCDNYLIYSVTCDGSQYFFPNMCPSSCLSNVYFQCTSNTGVAIKKECNNTLGLFWNPQQLTCNYRSSVNCAEEEEDSPSKCTIYSSSWRGFVFGQ
ncbi:hypothetical protein CHS0354_016058 [Potamilus streckersoni]|uniref:Chitin-binding type-2 domain-containing protein n=1 Tax=Potamilus streckersoni TaxID=2493646 RepID=A0AAE0T0T1_9BIVA|nr:hypothetical protein CHS0354_016058 [Potamilus streckersoni]